MVNRKTAAGLAAALMIFGHGTAAAQQSRSFEPSVIMAPPVSQQTGSQVSAPSKIDPARAPADEIFSAEARLNLRLARLEKQLDQIIKQNIILKQQLDQAKTGLAEMDSRLKAHANATSYSSSGLSLINMVGQILAKVSED